MPSVLIYSEQQARFDLAFGRGGTCCDVTCGECGRTYFVTGPGHGDYPSGVLDCLRQKAVVEPDKFIEVPDFSSMTSLILGGKTVVIGCVCDPTKRYSDWIEERADELIEYLRLLLESKRTAASAEQRHCVEQLERLRECGSLV